MTTAQLNIYPDYYKSYFELCSGENLMDALHQRLNVVEDFYHKIPEDQWQYTYEPKKWTIAQVVQHIIDAEVIFLYRAVSIVRGEKQRLPGWDEDAYAASMKSENISLSKSLILLKNMMLLTEHYFDTFDHDDLQRSGNMNTFDSQVGAIGFALLAHERHHRNMLKVKYGIS